MCRNGFWDRFGLAGFAGFNLDLFEGVSSTTVIFAPGACRREAPSSTSGVVSSGKTGEFRAETAESRAATGEFRAATAEFWQRVDALGEKKYYEPVAMSGMPS